MKALITGFTGQVGSQMADFLLENTDYKIIALMRCQESMDNIYHLSERINRGDRISIFYADLNDYSSLQKLFETHRPDVIFHLAAQSFPKTSFEIPLEALQTNIIGTANILENIRLLKQKDGYDPVVHICSSSEIYGRAQKGIKLDENTPFHGASPYSISKIGTDYLGRFYGEAYGIRTFQDARDAVRAYYLLSLESAKGNVPCGECFNIAGEEAFKLPEIIEILLEFSNFEGGGGAIRILEDSDRLRPIDADYQMFDNTKIKRFIDWRAEIPVRQMLKDLLDHWRAEIKKGRIPLNR
ncbi:GDP-mannose 4,6-dehydratase [Campylobacter upsaliensis]|nr:GDP-mannose 4,6-dehydratase [Campylobacter upsaliensis]ELJ7112370.1 GDP-mannose 4,6-dehydratase [Campylobacter upsaliensis]